MGENLSAQRWTKAFKEKLQDSRILATRKLVNSYLQSKSNQSKEVQFWIQGSAVNLTMGK